MIQKADNAIREKPGEMGGSLVGRSREIGTLRAAFDRARDGGRGLVLVSGPPGIGKTALVRELRGPAASAGGHFIEGKYEQYSRDIPYSAVSQAFGEYARRVCSGGRDRIAAWKGAIMEVLGANARVLVDTLPDLAMILGEQPAVPVLGPRENQNRFIYVFRKFMATILRDAPFVVFLDDLQWADPASLALLVNLLADADLSRLLVAGVCRDVEGSAPALTGAIEEMSRHAPVERIPLAPLDERGVAEIVGHYLSCGQEGALARIVYRATGGNPFFTHQVMQMLHERGALRPDGSEDAGGLSRTERDVRRTWDPSAMGGIDMPRSVLELMAGKIASLPRDARSALRVASCIGTVFDLELLAAVRGSQRERTRADLSPAADDGLVALSDGACRFHHDKILEAAYSAIPPAERVTLHYRIGRIMLDRAGLLELDERIIPIVDQLIQGIALVTDDAERSRFASLALKAGRKAKCSMAYQSAMCYLRAGIELIGDGWERQYDLAMALVTEAAEAAYLCADYAAMEHYAGEAHGRSREVFDKVDLYRIRFNAAFVRGDFLGSADIFFAVSRLLGFAVPRSVGPIRIILEYLAIRIALLGRNIEGLIDLKLNTDPRVERFLQIANDSGYSLYITSPRLMIWLLLRCFRLQMKHGASLEVMQVFIACYGMFLCAVMKDVVAGNRLGRLATDFIEKYRVRPHKAKTLEIVYLFLLPFKEHLASLTPKFLAMYHAGLENGELESAGLGIHQYCNTQLFTGVKLSVVREVTARYAVELCQMNHATAANFQNIYLQAIINLIEGADDPCRLAGAAYDEAVSLPLQEQARDHIALSCMFSLKMILADVFNEYDAGLEFSEKADPHMESMIGQYHVPIFQFHASLVRAALVPSRPARDQARLVRYVRKNQKRLRRWARHAPMNYLHKYHLVEAELARIKGDAARAKELYARAIAGARENGYPHEEALACERAASYHRGRGERRDADRYLAMSRERYLEWGALAKVRQLENAHPECRADSEGCVPGSV